MKIKNILLVFFLTSTFMNNLPAQSKDPSLTGAWHITEGENEHVLIIEDGFIFHTHFSKAGKKFFSSQGGTLATTNKEVSTKVSFSTNNKEEVGKQLKGTFSIDGNTLDLSINRQTEKWKRLDNGSAAVAGVWRITSRMQDGKLTPIHQTGARQTYKILSGTRFQWAAINPDTKEFFGTGGGTYTFSNGKYTETIEFFSRDSSRVGASLSFDGKLENGEWHHSGVSSKGEKIHEVWSRVK
jgi:hypothetical protein